MQAWKRTFSNNKPVITGIDLSDIDTNKQILFIFPGKGNVGDKNFINDSDRVALSGFVKLVENIIADKNVIGSTDINIISYESLEANINNRNNSNRLLDGFTEPEADKFTDEFLIPLIEQGLSNKITFFSQSYGAVFAQNIRVSTIAKLREKEYSDEKIGTILESIVLVATGNVSSATTPGRPDRNHKLDYTSVYFTSATDNMAKEANPDYHKTIPEAHESFTISKLEGNNRLQVTVNTPENVLILKESEEKTSLEIIHDASRHTIRMFSQVGAGSSIGGVKAVERALYNAVTRTDQPCAIQLLRKIPKSNNRSNHAVNGGLDINELAINTALSSLPQSIIKVEKLQECLTQPNEKSLV